MAERGRCVSWEKENDCGMISPLNNNKISYFTHITDIVDGIALNVGDLVEYQLYGDGFGFDKAGKVRKVKHKCNIQYDDKKVEIIHQHDTTFHLWTEDHTKVLRETILSWSTLHIPVEICYLLELFIHSYFAKRVPHYPYPQELFKKVQKEFFYYQIKIAVLGDKNVGKTDLILQHLRNKYCYTDSDETVYSGYDKSDEYFAKQTNIEHFGKYYECQLGIYSDLTMIFGEAAYQDVSYPMFHGMSPAKPIPIDVYILVFDLFNESTFNWLIDETKKKKGNIIKKIRKVKKYTNDEQFCIILVGNKCDLSTEKELEADKVSMEKIDSFCAKYYCPFIECSGKNNMLVEELFDVAVKEAIMYKGEVDHDFTIVYKED